MVSFPLPLSLPKLLQFWASSASYNHEHLRYPNTYNNEPNPFNKQRRELSLREKRGEREERLQEKSLIERGPE